MSATSQPFGLRPSYVEGGQITPAANTIVSGYAAAIYQNQPVRIAPSTGGGETEGTIVAAAVGERFIGTFQGVEYTDSDGRRRVSNKWTASQVGTDSIAYYTRNPYIVYEIQSDATLAIDSVGKQYNLTTITGNTTTGLSSQMLGVSTAASNASLRVIGLAPGPDNNWGDDYVIVQVQISEHQNVADIAAY